MATFRVALNHPNALVPTRADPGAAGYDLYASITTAIPARGRAIVPTGVRLEMPPTGYYGRVAPRSGTTVKLGLDVGAGVIDASYRGDIGVVMFNHTDADVVLEQGDRIAQLIFECITTPTLTLVLPSELGSTDRGEGGFGSTGA